VSHLNPIFYMVDGFRYGFFGHADVPPLVSLSIVALCFFALSWLTYWLIKTGYKLRY
jgi:ABC-2 type transport system permease protein